MIYRRCELVNPGSVEKGIVWVGRLGRLSFPSSSPAGWTYTFVVSGAELKADLLSCVWTLYLVPGTHCHELIVFTCGGIGLPWYLVYWYRNRRIVQVPGTKHEV